MGGIVRRDLRMLLSCGWICWQVDRRPLERGFPDPLDRRWIASGGGGPPTRRRADLQAGLSPPGRDLRRR